MNELSRHIETLLTMHDCVIVPHLGGFITHYVAAHYDEEDNSFFPPLRTLGYNPQLNVNDSLLAQSYVEAYDLSFPEALERIAAEVDQLKEELKAEGSYDLPGIGVLIQGDEGRVSFEPCEAGLLTPTLYGLGALQIEHVHSAPRAKEIIRKKATWMSTAAAVAALIVCLLITLPLGGPKMQAPLLKSSMWPVATESNTAPKVQEVKKEEPTAVKEEVEDAPDPLNYTIVLASQTTLRHANAFVEELKKQGFTEARVLQKGRMTRVVYGAYATDSEAKDSISKLRLVAGDAWVMKLQ